MSWRQEPCSGLWRSEDMVRLDLILQREVLHDSIFEISLMGAAQFVDMSKESTQFTRPFGSDLRRCDELLRKLRCIETELTKLGSAQRILDTDMCASVEEMRCSLSHGQLALVEERIEAMVAEVAVMNTSLEGLVVELNRSKELSRLYDRLGHLLHDRVSTNFVSSDSLRPTNLRSLACLPTLLGVITAERSESLHRLCYRFTRGNAVIHIHNEPETFTDPRTGANDFFKATFIVVCSSVTMVTRLRKHLVTYGATIYTMEEVCAQGENGSLLSGVPTTDVPMDVPSTDMHRVFDDIQKRREESLLRWYDEHRIYKTFVMVEKKIFATMNLCLLSGSTCVASVWVPRRHEAALKRALDSATVSAGGGVQSVVTPCVSQKHPPTYFETNRFTVCFQNIVDSYGMARYKEVNPGVFTIITFPYLFGIMYGDMGHGTLLLLGSLYLIAKTKAWGKEPVNEILAMLISGRYLLLLMSFFAIYMGILYNDFFGFSLNLFRSGYRWSPIAEQSGAVYPLVPNGRPSVKPPRVYPMGLDIAWAETENKLEFYNSVKMKCAVIVGVVQMLAGLSLSLCNAIYKGERLRIWLMVIPEFVFLLATFGYMSVLIVVKWCTHWENTHMAPSLLETMTNFFLQPGSVPVPLYRGQAVLQVFLLILAFAMVPVMLIGMPMVEKRRHRVWKQRMNLSYRGNIPMPYRHSNVSAPANESSNAVFVVNSPGVGDEIGRRTSGVRQDCHDNLMSNGSMDDIFSTSITLEVDGEDDSLDEDMLRFDFSEVMIHYIIHTIEYVLGCVSNTASYLRLWALSLAHAQLSEVFFTFAVVNVLSVDTTGVGIAVGAMVWLIVTIGVLVGMEALSAFLHALRLHWVEFQNKFYTGDGVALEVLSLVQL